MGLHITRDRRKWAPERGGKGPGWREAPATADTASADWLLALHTDSLLWHRAPGRDSALIAARLLHADWQCCFTTGSESQSQAGVSDWLRLCHVTALAAKEAGKAIRPF